MVLFLHQAGSPLPGSAQRKKELPTHKIEDPQLQGV